MSKPEDSKNDIAWQPKYDVDLSVEERAFMRKQFAIMDWACSLSLPALFLRARGYAR